MKVKDVINRVTTRYNDHDYARVSQDMYLSFLDDALNQLILARPDANVKTEVVQLAPGTRQSIPTDGYNLIAIYRNMTSDGAGGYSEGAPILQVERNQLDIFSSWHTGTTVNLVEEFAYDERSPRTFWVSQPLTSDENVYVEMDYSFGVDRYANMVDDFSTIMEMDIPINDVFLSPIVTYMLYLMYTTDSSSQNDMIVAQRYEQSFYQSLGIEYKATILVKPTVINTEEGGTGAAAA